MHGGGISNHILSHQSIHKVITKIAKYVSNSGCYDGFQNQCYPFKIIVNSRETLFSWCKSTNLGRKRHNFWIMKCKYEKNGPEKILVFESDAPGILIWHLIEWRLSIDQIETGSVNDAML